eukprot:GFYU01031730.1.p1 GENE.GFYU01031730.1~~GFYU01031730.1.p1  ORF type:complete len:283 (-),score=-38.30 GFYU01031730.1:76-924(-)
MLSVPGFFIFTNQKIHFHKLVCYYIMMLKRGLCPIVSSFGSIRRCATTTSSSTATRTQLNDAPVTSLPPPLSRNKESMKALLRPTPTPTHNNSIMAVDIHLVVDVLNLDMSSSFEYFRTALYESDFQTPQASPPPVSATTHPTYSMNALRDIFTNAPFKIVCLDEDLLGAATTTTTTITDSPTMSTMAALASLHPHSRCVSFQVDSGPESGDYFGAALLGKLEQHYRRVPIEGLRPVFVILSHDRLFKRSLERSFPGGLVVYPPALTPAVLVPFLRSFSTAT